VPPVVVGRGRLPTACLPPLPSLLEKVLKRPARASRASFFSFLSGWSPLGGLIPLQLRLSLMNRRRGLFSVNQ